jgi:serine/threonine protein kinase
MISFLCSHCGAQLRVKPELAGVSAKCPRCGKRVEAPSGVSNTEQAGPGATFETVTARDGDLDFLAPPQAPDEIGRLGKYRVLKLLGQGGMGLVLAAEDVTLKRAVALKVMKKSQAAFQENRIRFIREARAAAALEHDNVVTIYEVSDEGDVPFIAMKLLVGESLEDRLNREGTLSSEEIIRIGQEIATGLAEAHERGLIHRDVKPANVWLEEGTGRVKILDFGLARACDEDVKLTQDNFLVGTPAYMSPEQAEGDRPLDARSDLFSLGGVLYRCATGELPFKGKNTLQVLTALATRTPPTPRDLNASISEALSDVVMKLLEKKPDDRPKTARLLIAALVEARDAPAGYEEVEDEEDEVEELEEIDDVEEVKPSHPRRKRRRAGGRPPSRQKRGKETSEERLARRVIWFGVIAAIGVFLLLAALIVKRTFFES